MPSPHASFQHNGHALWKCRPAGTVENQTAVFHRFLSPWKSQKTRFPHSHSAYNYAPSPNPTHRSRPAGACDDKGYQSTRKESIRSHQSMPVQAHPALE
jgi:hypothetical protein